MLSPLQLKKKVRIDSFVNNKVTVLKIDIPAGNASVTPPVGPLLGQYGINTMDFCREFNEETKTIEKDTIISIKLFFAQDRTFYFQVKPPSVSYFLKKFFESEEVDFNFSGINKQIYLKYIYDIAILRIFLYDINTKISPDFIKNYIRSIVGTSRSFKFFIK